MTLLSDTLTWHSCRTPLLDMLSWHSCRTLLLDTLTWRSYLTLLWDARTRQSCKTPLHDTVIRHSYLTLLQDTLTSVTQTHPLQTPLKSAATDHSHRHLLCKRHYNCSATDTSSANGIITAVSQVNLTPFGTVDSLTALTQTVGPSRKRLRTVADDCGRLRTVANGWQHRATFGEHSLTPRPSNSSALALSSRIL